jgi:hypothetical protein
MWLHPLMANCHQKAKGKTMHLELFSPILAIGTASSGAAFIVILTVLAVLRGR